MAAAAERGQTAKCSISLPVCGSLTRSGGVIGGTFFLLRPGPRHRSNSSWAAPARGSQPKAIRDGRCFPSGVAILFRFALFLGGSDANGA